MFVILSNFVKLVIEVLLMGVNQIIWKHEGGVIGKAGNFTFTASKFIRESTAVDAALLSALLASRRNRVLA